MLVKFRKLILQIVAGTVGIWLAKELINGVTLEAESLRVILYIGLILGFINFFIKPLLNAITLPVRIITFGLFSLVINMAIVWAVDVYFLELGIEGLHPLFWTTILVWTLSLIASRI